MGYAGLARRDWSHVGVVAWTGRDGKHYVLREREYNMPAIPASPCFVGLLADPAELTESLNVALWPES